MASLMHALLQLACLFCVLAPNARPISKYLADYRPGLLLPLYVGLMAGFFCLIRSAWAKERFGRLLGSFWSAAAMLAVAGLIVWFVYPVADGLKLQMRGSDSDDCIVLGATRIAQLLHPYLEYTYFGNPCSPGVGALLAYAPFVLLGAYPLGSIFALAAAAYAVSRHAGGQRHATVFLATFLSSVFAMEMLVVGSDLVMLGCGILIACLGLVPAIERRDARWLVGLAVLVGLLSSWRVNFMVLPPLFSALVFVHWRKGSFAFLAISATVAVAPSLFVYMLDPGKFTPFHVVSKGLFLVPLPLQALVIAVSAALALAGVWMVSRAPRRLPLAVFISLFPGLGALSLSSLIAVAPGNAFFEHVALWGPATYLVPVMPLAVMLLGRRAEGPSHS